MGASTSVDKGLALSFHVWALPSRNSGEIAGAIIHMEKRSKKTIAEQEKTQASMIY